MTYDRAVSAILEISADIRGSRGGYKEGLRLVLTLSYIWREITSFTITITIAKGRLYHPSGFANYAIIIDYVCTLSLSVRL